MNIDRLYLDENDIQELFGFFLKWRDISAPHAKENYKEIIGMQGALDLTEKLGEVFYDNRTLNLGMKHPGRDWYSDFESMMNMFHGKTVHISFGNDPDWYYSGRLSIDGYSARNHELSMSASVFPFKMAKSKTIISRSINAANEDAAETIDLSGSRLKVSPMITVTTGTGITLKWGERTVTLDSGSRYVDGLTVGPSGLTIKAWGTGDLQISYRVGLL